MSTNYLDEFRRLSREEWHALVTSGAFTGFSEQDIAEAGSEKDRDTMRLINEGFRLVSEARRLAWRRGQ